MFCTKCGKENNEGNKFCLSCGNPLNNTNQNNQAESSFQNPEEIQSQVNINKPQQNINSNQNIQNQVQNTNNNTIKVVLITLGCVLIALGLFFGINYIITQAKLRAVDRQAAEAAKKINDDFNKMYDDDSGKSGNSSTRNSTYEEGDSVTLVDGSKWHVISVNNKNIVLLYDKLVGDIMGYGSTGSEEDQKYENSNLKKYIEETYLPQLKSSLEKYDGDTSNLTARLITADEFLKLSGLEFSDDYTYAINSFNATDKQNENREGWLHSTDSYWTMSNIKEYNPSYDKYGAYCVLTDVSATLNSDFSAGASDYLKGSYYGIRPVIETTIDNIK